MMLWRSRKHLIRFKLAAPCQRSTDMSKRKIATGCCLGFILHMMLPTPEAAGQSACGYDWDCWNMLDYDDVPVWPDALHPGSYNPDEKSPLLIYLHSNGPYGGSGKREEELWLKLWDSGYDEHEWYQGLKNWVVEGPGGEDTGWIYAMPNGAIDSLPVSDNCPMVEGLRYWNATPNCCAYNWYTPGSYTEVSGEAPDHVTYLNNLIAYLKTQYNVDEDRVYIFGYSNGGYMCHRLACENGNIGLYNYPDYDVDPSGEPVGPQAIAAVGTYAGVTFMNPTNCNGVWPTNVLHTHDIGDQSCLYDGGIDTEYSGVCYPGLPRPYPGALMTISSWIFMNQTSGVGKIEEPIIPFDLGVPDSYAEVINWDEGRYGSSVEHWRGIFGSHGARFSNAYRNRLINWFLENERPDYPLGEPCFGDFNRDDEINGSDLAYVLNQWGRDGDADINGDSTVGGADLSLLLNFWGPCED